MGLADQLTVVHDDAADPGIGRGCAAPALTHGFHVAFYALTVMALVGVVIAAFFVEGRPQQAEIEPLGTDSVATLEEAA